MTWTMKISQLVGHGPLADIRATMLFLILPSAIAFIPSRFLIYAWMRHIELRSSTFSPAAASSALAVLLVAAIDMLLFILQPSHSWSAILSGSFLAILLFAPMAFVLAPVFSIYMLYAVRREERVISGAFVYVVVAACLILQHLSFVYWANEKHG